MLSALLLMDLLEPWCLWRETALILLLLYQWVTWILDPILAGL